MERETNMRSRGPELRKQSNSWLNAKCSGMRSILEMRKDFCSCKFLSGIPPCSKTMGIQEFGGFSSRKWLQTRFVGEPVG